MKKSIKVLALAAISALSMAMTAGATEDGGIVIIDAGQETSADISVDDNTVIQEGIYFGDESVGGLTAAQARTVIENHMEQVSQMTLRLTSSAGYADFSMADMSPECTNVDDMIAQAVGVEHVGSLLTQYKQEKDIQCNSLHIDYKISFTMDNVMNYIVENKSSFECSPQNATVAMNADGSFTVVPSVDGFTVDYDATYTAIEEAVEECDTTSAVVTCQVAGTTTPAAYDTSVFDGFGDILGEASTEYRTTGDQANRAENVRLGTKHCNGIILMPGEQFSYCQAIQPFTAEEGYKCAGTYTESGVSNELGGGLCQVSTTLYDACLWAELQIDYRKPHSKTVDYVPYSMDAMVYVREGQDYKFTNNTTHAIYIQAYSTVISSGKEKITFRIYGTEYRPENRTVKYVSITDSTTTPDPVYKIVYDDTLDVYPQNKLDATYSYATQAHMGATSHLVKEVYVDGVLASSETISSDRYKASQGVFYMNSKSVLETMEFDDQLGICNLVFKKATATTTTQAPTTTVEETTTEKETTAEETTTTTAAPTTEAPTTEAPTTVAETAPEPETAPLDDTAA